jgi:hypothetical protein
MADEPKIALNVRDFPSDLRWKCKRAADGRRMTLREFVIDILRGATKDEPELKPAKGKKGGV